MIDGNYMIDGDMGYDPESPYYDDRYDLEEESKLHSTPDWWNDLYTDANGNCYSDAEGGL